MPPSSPPAAALSLLLRRRLHPLLPPASAPLDLVAGGGYNGEWRSGGSRGGCGGATDPEVSGEAADPPAGATSPPPRLLLSHRDGGFAARSRDEWAATDPAASGRIQWRPPPARLLVQDVFSFDAAAAARRGGGEVRRTARASDGAVAL